MNVDHKLQGFMEMALAEAAEERNKIKAEIDEEYNKACDEITKEAQKKADERYKEACHKAEQQKNKQILQAMSESRMSLIDMRKQFQNEMFENVEKMLEEFMDSEEYFDYLVEELKKQREETGDMIIYLCKRDMVHAGKIAEAFNTEVVESDEDFIGGFKIKYQNITIDNSFQTRIIRTKQNHNAFKIID